MLLNNVISSCNTIQEALLKYNIAKQNNLP